MILEYKLDAGPQGMHCPYWVDNGGYYLDPDNFTMVGVSPTNREYKIPDSVTKLTKDQLTTRVLDIHRRYPMMDGTTNKAMTTQQVTDNVAAWCAAFDS